MSSLKSTSSGRVLVRLMKFCGMWSFEDSFYETKYRIYRWTMQTIFSFMFILSMYIKIGTVRNLDDLPEMLYMALTETALLVKLLNIMVFTRRAVELLKIFEQYGEGTPQNRVEQLIVRQADTKFSRLRNFYLAGSSMVVISGAVSGLFDKSYNLPFACWMPFDYKTPKTFYYAYIFVVGGIAFTACCNCTMDLFQAFLLLQLSIYYKLLGCRWEMLGYGQEKSLMLLKYFQKNLEFHQYIIRLTAECERLISIPSLVQILLSALVLCFTVYTLRNISFSKNPSDFMKFFTFAIVVSLQIYLLCFYGNELTNSSGNVLNCLYNSNWVEMPTETRRAIFIYMEYLKRPVVVQAGNFFRLGLRLFTQTMNNAYSLYALLLKI